MGMVWYKMKSILIPTIQKDFSDELKFEVKYEGI